MAERLAQGVRDSRARGIELWFGSKIDFDAEWQKHHARAAVMDSLTIDPLSDGWL